MDCRKVERLLSEFLDGEIDLTHHQHIERHLTECSNCCQIYEQMRTVQSALASASLYRNAPHSLRDKIEAIIKTPSFEGRPVRKRLFANSFINVAAAMLLLALVGVALFVHRKSNNEQAIMDQVVANHLHSIQVEHLTDKISADPEALKTWLNAKVDFSPEVIDLSEKGYALAGARLAPLDEQVVPVIVYRIQEHVINVFCAPVKHPLQQCHVVLDDKGLHVRHWDAYGTTYWAISDLNGPQFDEFIKILNEKITHFCAKFKGSAE